MELVKYFDDKLAAVAAETAELTDAKQQYSDDLAASEKAGHDAGYKEAQDAYQKPDPANPDAQYTQAQLAAAVDAKAAEMQSKIDEVTASEAAVKADYDAFKVKADADRDAAVSAREDEIAAQYEAEQSAETTEEGSFAAKIRTPKSAPVEPTPAPVDGGDVNVQSKKKGK